MRYFTFLCLVSSLTAQEINPIPGDTILNGPFITTMGQYQDTLLAYTISPENLLKINLNTNETVQIYDFKLSNGASGNSLKIFNQSLYIGFNDLNAKYFYVFQVNNIQTGYQIINASSSVFCFESFENFLFIGTLEGIEKFDLNTFQRLESVSIGYVTDMLKYKDSLIVASTKLHERSLYNLTQVTSTYGTSRGKLALNETFLFAAYSSVIDLWNLTTKQYHKSFYNHTSSVESIAVIGDFLFSGSFDAYWIQWELISGNIQRKVNTGTQIFTVLIDVPFLYVGGEALLKYEIPELINFTKSTKTEIQSSTIEVSQDQTTRIVSATSEILLSNEKFTLSPLTTKLTVDPHLSNSGFTFPSLYLILYVAIAVLVLVGAGFLAYFLQSRSNRNNTVDMYLKSKGMATTTITMSSTTTYSESSTMSTQPTTSYIENQPFTETDSTWIGTQNAYSVPGFLELRPDHVRVLSQIAKGGQGTISLAEILDTSFVQTYKTKQVIVKSAEKNFDKLSNHQKNAFNQELAIIHYFKERPGFVRVYGYTLEPACLILKFYPLGNMENLIKNRGQFKNFTISKRFILIFLRELSKSLFLLHDAGFVHCDIKPQNILIETDHGGQFHPILTDFGITQIVSSKVLQVKAMTIENLKGFSVHYAAPEQIIRSRKNFLPLSAEMVKRQDIYAIAGLLYALIMGKEPFSK